MVPKRDLSAGTNIKSLPPGGSKRKHCSSTRRSWDRCSRTLTQTIVSALKEPKGERFFSRSTFLKETLGTFLSLFFAASKYPECISTARTGPCLAKYSVRFPVPQP